MQDTIFEVIGIKKDNNFVPDGVAVLYPPYAPQNLADVKLPKEQLERLLTNNNTYGNGYRVKFESLKMLNTSQGIRHYQADSWEFYQE